MNTTIKSLKLKKDESVLDVREVPEALPFWSETSNSNGNNS